MSVQRSVLLVSGAVLAVAAAGAGAWFTRTPPNSASPTSNVLESKPAGKDSAFTVDPAEPVVVPLAEAPPEPTGADFTRETASSSPSTSKEPAAPLDLGNLPIDELRAKAVAEDNAAMEELARRLLQGVGVTKDQQAGAGWLLRAAQHGSPQAAFNVGVMYERGFVVERDSVRAVEWYRKAVQANLPMAKHNLALMLRDGKGAPRDGTEAVELLRSATRQGMAASMFALADIYERGEGTSKDLATALAWFAITAEFERQTNRNGESALAKTATQRANALQRTLLPGELERAQQIGQTEFKQIVEALQPPKLPPPAPTAPPPEAAAPPAAPPPSEAEADPPGWPKTTPEQIRAIQQALVDLKLLRDKPDGVIGPMTRTAIKTFQKNIGAREIGEPTKDVFAALQEAMAKRDSENRPPDLGQPEAPPPPPTSADIEYSAPKPN